MHPDGALTGIEGHQRLRALPVIATAGEIAVSLAHEINNPLAALLGQAQLLLRDLELNDKQRRRAETIESQAKRIEEIVGELRSIQTPARTLNRQDE